MADNGYRPPPRKKIALDHPKFNLTIPNKSGKNASLRWGLVGSNPRITVYTNEPDDQVDNGRIQAALDIATFMAILGKIAAAANSEGAFEPVKCDCMNYTWGGGKRSDQPTTVSSVIIGKDEDGGIWISVSAPRRPQIKFYFLNPDFHHWYHKSGQQFSKAEASKLYALAYVEMLRLVVPHLLVVEYVEPPPKDQNGGNRGGGGGGYNRGGQGGGGYNRNNNSGGGGGNRQEPAADVGGDDDIPW